MKSKTKPVNPQCHCVTCRSHPQSAVTKEHRAINRVSGALDEKRRRRFAGLLAWQWGQGSIARLSKITGLSRPTIRRGRNEVQRSEPPAERGRVRHAGAGRPAVEKNTPGCWRPWTTWCETPRRATQSEG